jgi:hypothetical protein
MKMRNAVIAAAFVGLAASAVFAYAASDTVEPVDVQLLLDDQQPEATVAAAPAINDGCLTFRVGKVIKDGEEDLFNLVADDELVNPIQDIVVRAVDLQAITACNKDKNEFVKDVFQIPGSGDVAITASLDANGVALIRLPKTDKRAFLYRAVCFSPEKKAVFQAIVTLSGDADVGLDQQFFGAPDPGECVQE